ncbi:MAG: hypothetical protein ACPHRO_06920, partial [Nannocystaceae bacterium]
MRRSNLLILSIAAATAAWIFPHELHAGGTRNTRVHTFSEFDEGSTKGTAIESSGRITVGTDVTRAEIEDVNSAFSCLAGKKHLYVGTADDASIRRVTTSRKGLQIKTVATLSGVVVTAMAELPSGHLIAATLPGGQLTEVTPKGKTSTFATLKDVKRIWALRIVGDRIFAGTGPKGEVWSLALDGSDPKVVLDSEAKDVLSLLELDGAVLAGTSPDAKVFQITDDPEGQLVHDFAGDEVRALAANERGLVAAVNDFESRKISTVKNLQAQLDRTNLSGAAPTRKSTSEASPDADAAIHYVDLTGSGKQRDLSRALEATWETWLDVEDQYFTALTTSSTGEFLVSSSRAGRVYRVKDRREHAVVADLEERLATSICRAGGRGKGPKLIATAGQGAAVYGLTDTAPDVAHYTSEVFDAGQPATYGGLIVRASGDVQAQARVGPTSEPDARWGDWKTVSLSPTAQGLRGDLGLPLRRFAQLRFILGSADAEVREFNFFYGPENLAPKVSSVEFEGPEFDQDDDEEPDPSAKITWKAKDDDDDELIYSVRIRPEGSDDNAWIDLGPQDSLVTKEELKFDVNSVPDGVYEASVLASDSPVNGTAQARTDEGRSPPFIVDRTRPTLTELRADGATISGRATDVLSNIHDVAFQIDDGPFQAASPVDGLFDSPDEGFELRLP